MITITVDTSQLDRKLADIPAALARAQRVALLEIGNVVKKHAPLGTPEATGSGRQGRRTHAATTPE